jgi:hypothetical protein
MNTVPDPAAMPPAARQAEVAEILARGWWRVWLSRTALDALPPIEPSCASAVDAAQIPPEEAHR